MPILIKTALGGKLESLLVHRESHYNIDSMKVLSAAVSFEGIEGDSHAALTRESCVRVKQQYPVGTEIRNTRQISIVSVEELAKIAEAMEVVKIQPEWLGANLVIEGVPDLTLLPPSSRMIFSSGLSLVVDMENAPCKYPAERIDQHYPGQGKYFIKCATGLRGVTAWVEREGMIKVGDEFVLHVPPQRLYPHA